MAAEHSRADRRPPPPGAVHEISVDVPVATEWVRLPATPASAIPVRRALDHAGRPYDASLGSINCRPADLRRALHLPRTDYLAGEPIVIEMSVRLGGPGTWHEPIGGNYRGRGRDDNFRFLVRAAGGDWVPDPYERFPVMVGGGLSTTIGVSSGRPFSSWLGVSRWAAVARPGVYDLYAVQFASGHEVAGLRGALAAAIPAGLRGAWSLAPDGNYLRDRRGRRGAYQIVPTLRDVPSPSPVAALLPPELRARLGAQAAAVQDYAHFRITVRAGTPAETAAMVARAIAAAQRPTHSSPGDEPGARRGAPAPRGPERGRAQRALLPRALPRARGDPCPHRPPRRSRRGRARDRRGAPAAVDRPVVRPRVGRVPARAPDARRGARDAAGVARLVGRARGDVPAHRAGDSSLDPGAWRTAVSRGLTHTYPP
jgi:hypothetical protein